MNVAVGNKQTAFKEGVKCRALQFTWETGEKARSRLFWLGYFLWGMDVWCGNIPVLKVLIGVNILNMILMWIVR